MNEDKQFFIGWRGELPISHRRLINNTIKWLFLVLIIIISTYTASEKGFLPSIYEYGQLTNHKGILYMAPHPVLQVKNTYNENVNYLLVGAGKFGAGKALRQWEENNGSVLDGLEVEIRGTLIYYDNFSLLELTEGPASIIATSKPNMTSSREEITTEPVSLTGEIIDVKCYFGAMKPGNGKIHKSCAIRCLSGGIPAGFKTTSGDYFLLELSESQFQEVIRVHTAHLVRLEGEKYMLHGMKYLKIERPIKQATSWIKFPDMTPLCFN